MYDLACSQEADAIEIHQGDISNRWSNNDRRFDEMLVVFLNCFCCLSMFCEVRVTKPAQEPPPKNKPLDAPNLHRHQTNKKKSRNYGSTSETFWVVVGTFVFLCFFGTCQSLVHLVFFFFGACQCFCKSHVKIMMKKVRFTRVLDPPST